MGPWYGSISAFEYESGRVSLVLPERQKWEIANAGTERPPRQAGLIQTAFDVCMCVKWAGGPEFPLNTCRAHVHVLISHTHTHVCAERRGPVQTLSSYHKLKHFKLLVKAQL